MNDMRIIIGIAVMSQFIEEGGLTKDLDTLGGIRERLASVGEDMDKDNGGMFPAHIAAIAAIAADCRYIRGV